MLRAMVGLVVLLLSTPALAMSGGAQPAPKFRHAVVMLAGQHGFCSGVAVGRDLVLTAAHCVLPATDYKLVAFDGAGQPVLRSIATIARHPAFDPAAMQRHTATADVALLKFAAAIS